MEKTPSTALSALSREILPRLPRTAPPAPNIAPTATRTPPSARNTAPAAPPGMTKRRLVTRGNFPRKEPCLPPLDPQIAFPPRASRPFVPYMGKKSPDVY